MKPFKKKNLNKFIKSSIVFLLILIGILSYIFFLSDSCKTVKVFSAFKDLGFNNIKPCISKGNL